MSSKYGSSRRGCNKPPKKDDIFDSVVKPSTLVRSEDNEKLQKSHYAQLNNEWKSEVADESNPSQTKMGKGSFLGFFEFDDSELLQEKPPKDKKHKEKPTRKRNQGKTRKPRTIVTDSISEKTPPNDHDSIENDELLVETDSASKKMSVAQSDQKRRQSIKYSTPVCVRQNNSNNSHRLASNGALSNITNTGFMQPSSSSTPVNKSYVYEVRKSNQLKTSVVSDKDPAYNTSSQNDLGNSQGFISSRGVTSTKHPDSVVGQLHKLSQSRPFISRHSLPPRNPRDLEKDLRKLHIDTANIISEQSTGDNRVDNSSSELSFTSFSSPKIDNQIEELTTDRLCDQKSIISQTDLFAESLAESRYSLNRSEEQRSEIYLNLSMVQALDTSVYSAEEKAFEMCGQSGPISFEDFIERRMMSKCVKIGEGVYGEVFKTFSAGKPVVLKIIPIEGEDLVNDCPQKKFEEILPEIVIARELSELAAHGLNMSNNFCHVNRVGCVKGAFAADLLDQWDAYAERKNSENDRPDFFSPEQLFIIFEFADGGIPLENYKFQSHSEALSVLQQAVFALAVAEQEMEFEHRDLHIGNVLVRKCQDEEIIFTLNGTDYVCNSEGVFVTIIDFTISRLKKDGCAVFCDISTDDGLFEGKGDIQFDVYRDMRSHNENMWKDYLPYTNILWVNYLCSKLLTTFKYKNTSRLDKAKKQLKLLEREIKNYRSCTQLAEALHLWSI